MSELAKQTYGLVQVGKIKQHPSNPKKGNVKAIRESVDENDFYGAVIVQKSTGHILVGNHRWLAAKAEGLKKIPVIWLDVDDKAAKKIMLADNRTSDLGGYDQDILKSVLQEVLGDDALRGTGYTEADVDRMVRTSEAPSPKVEEFEATVKVHYTCPKCAFEWS